MKISGKVYSRSTHDAKIKTWRSVQRLNAVPAKNGHAQYSQEAHLNFRSRSTRRTSSNLKVPIDVEMGLFTPMVFGTHELFLSNLTDKLSRKNGESYTSDIPWLRTRISFEILRLVHTCVRGSRTPFHKNADFLDDFSVNAKDADIF